MKSCARIAVVFCYEICGLRDLGRSIDYANSVGRLLAVGLPLSVCDGRCRLKLVLYTLPL